MAGYEVQKAEAKETTSGEVDRARDVGEKKMGSY